MDIKLLNEVSWGGNLLAPVVDWALRELKLDYNFELIENPIILQEMNIKKTPAMVINGDVVLEGRIPSGPEIIEILKESFENIRAQSEKE